MRWGGGGWQTGSGLSGVHQSGGGGGGGANPPVDQPIEAGAPTTSADAPAGTATNANDTASINAVAVTADFMGAQ
jgi:hypothetical protein